MLVPEKRSKKYALCDVPKSEIHWFRTLSAPGGLAGEGIWGPDVVPTRSTCGVQHSVLTDAQVWSKPLLTSRVLGQNKSYFPFASLYHRKAIRKIHRASWQHPDNSCVSVRESYVYRAAETQASIRTCCFA